MDIFQLIADVIHLFAILILILKILNSKSISGLSRKTQQILIFVFLFRYVDLFFQFKTFYLLIMKIIFLVLISFTYYLMRWKKPYCLCYDQLGDNFPHYFLYIVAFLLTIFIKKSFNWMQFLWSYSIWLEAVAIIPQLLLIRKFKDVENITAHYVFLLGLYRMFYILHWITHWNGIYWVSLMGGITQSVLYMDFIYYFIIAQREKQKILFPI